MINVLARITDLRKERNWTEYQLAQNAHLPQSTISSWYRKNMLPSLSSLEKICDAYGITLSQFFQEIDEPFIIVGKQIELINAWDKLNDKQKELLLDFLKTL